MAVKKANTGNKRLTRLEKGKVIAGVCIGLAKYFEIDPVILRVILIFITLFGGSGLVFYLILWLVIPSEKSDGNLSEDNIKNNAMEIKEKAEGFGKSASEFAESKNSKYVLGICLLALGILLTLSNFGFFHYFNIWKLWPLTLIVLAFVIFRDNGKGN
jgi:phage shock protein C